MPLIKSFYINLWSIMTYVHAARRVTAVNANQSIVVAILTSSLADGVVSPQPALRVAPAEPEERSCGARIPSARAIMVVNWMR